MMAESKTNWRRIAAIAGLIGGSAWIVKYGVMMVQGGPVPDSVPENVAFFTGLIGVVVAAISAGVALAGTGSLGRRLLFAAGGVLAVALLLGIGQGALSAIPGESWMQAEAVFPLIGFLAVILAAVGLRSKPRY